LVESSVPRPSNVKEARLQNLRELYDGERIENKKASSGKKQFRRK
jgi:hypothetical protein